MNVMILAAGLGERMRPLTNDVPKPLLAARGRPLIDYQLFALARAGFGRAVINVHYLADQIMSHIGNGARYGIEVVFSEEAELLGTAGGVRKALPLLGPEPFAVLNADIFTDYDFAALPTQLGGKLGHLVMVDNPSWHPSGDFGIDAQGILNAGPDRLTYGCISVYEPALFREGNDGPRTMRELYDPAVERGQLTGEHFRGMWCNVGTPEQLAALNSMIE